MTNEQKPKAFPKVHFANDQAAAYRGDPVEVDVLPTAEQIAYILKTWKDPALNRAELAKMDCGIALIDMRRLIKAYEYELTRTAALEKLANGKQAEVMRGMQQDAARSTVARTIAMMASNLLMGQDVRAEGMQDYVVQVAGQLMLDSEHMALELEKARFEGENEERPNQK